MKKYGLVGYPLGHSFSSGYFSRKFEREGLVGYTYENIAVEDASKILAMTRHLTGFNVTIPHKINIIPYLDRLTDEASAVGAVNCVGRERGSGALVGSNTDVIGFRESLLAMIGTDRPEALVLGASGGAARAVTHVLRSLDIGFVGVSRQATGNGITYREVDAACMNAHRLIINCTPLGMSPNVDSAPEIPYDCFTPQHYALDLVYNPSETRFLRLARERGSRVKNGMDMLVRQAEAAWQIWQGEE